MNMAFLFTGSLLYLLCMGVALGADCGGGKESFEVSGTGKSNPKKFAYVLF